MANPALLPASRTLAVAVVLGALATALIAAQRPVRTFRLAGRVDLLENGRRATDRSLDRTHAVVWFEPSRSGPPPRAVVAEMLTVRKQFAPQVLVVPVGSTVRFPNRDPILHNVFSVSGKNSFDLGLVGRGEGKEATFPETGIVRVFCNVHHGMFGHVVVVPTSYFAVPDRYGRFEIEGVPAGTGTLRYWHERAEVGSTRVGVPVSGEVSLRVEITQPRVPPHRNKFGRSYSRGAYGG